MFERAPSAEAHAPFREEVEQQGSPLVGDPDPGRGILAVGSAGVPPVPLPLPRPVRCHHPGSLWWVAATQPAAGVRPAPGRSLPPPLKFDQKVAKNFCSSGQRKNFSRICPKPRRALRGLSRFLIENFWRNLPIRFLRTDSRNNFESWQKDVVSHFLSDIGKDQYGRAQNENGSKNDTMAPRTTLG